MNLLIGKMELSSINGGALRIDGGSMFGLIPKALWSRKAKADEMNRINLTTNCLLVRTPDCLVLIDSGYGTTRSESMQRNYHLEDGDRLVENLAAVGVAPEDIGMVILTHLHFDHAGGCTRPTDEGDLQPTFPNARHVIQRAEWEDAISSLPELAGAYYLEDIKPLEDAGLVDLIEGDQKLIPGVRVQLIGGHTRGHQIVHLGEGDSEEHAVYLADLCPTSAHLRTLWGMSYDQDPLLVRRTRPEMLGEIADQDWIAIFEHDPDCIAARLSRDPKQEFVIRERVAL